MADFEYLGDLVATLDVHPDDPEIVETVTCVLCDDPLVSATSTSVPEAMQLIASHLEAEHPRIQIDLEASPKPENGQRFVWTRGPVPEHFAGLVEP